MKSQEAVDFDWRLIGKRSLVIGAMALIALSAACGGSKDSAVVDLAGIWRLPAFDSYIAFNEDGTYVVSRTIEGLENAQLDVGRWTLEGAIFTMIAGDDSTDCAPGDRGVYDVELTSETSLRMIKQEDDCTIRSTVNLERVP